MYLCIISLVYRVFLIGIDSVTKAQTRWHLTLNRAPVTIACLPHISPLFVINPMYSIERISSALIIKSSNRCTFRMWCSLNKQSLITQLAVQYVSIEIGLKSGSREFVETGHEIIDLIPAFF